MATLIELKGTAATDVLEVGGVGKHTITAAEAAAKKFTVAGIGEFDWTTAADQVVFNVDSKLAAGTYSLKLPGANKFENVNFKAANAGLDFTVDAAWVKTGAVYTVDGGKGNDAIKDITANAKVSVGAGDDLVTVKDGESVTANVSLGAGADTVRIGNAAGTKILLDDYNAYEGDMIVLGAANETLGIGTILDNAGALAINGSTNGTVETGVGKKVGIEEGIYKAVVKDGKDTITEFYTAVAGNVVSIDKDFSKSVVHHVVDGSTAAKVKVALGYGVDNVSVSTVVGAVDTIVGGIANGMDNIVKNFSAEDVLSLEGATIDNIKISDKANATIAPGTDLYVDYVGSKIKFDSHAAAAGGTKQGSIMINDKKVAFALTVGKTLSVAGANTDAKDAAMAIGFDSTTVLEVEGTAHLSDKTKYKKIQQVSLAAADAEGVSLTGAQGVANTLDASISNKGVAVWGNSGKADTIKLKATNNAQDTVWFGAKDGKDTVSGFGYGIGDKADIVYLMDVAKVQDLKVDNATIKSGSAEISLNASANAVVQMKLADQKVYNVVGDFTGTANRVTVDASQTDCTKLDYYAFSDKADNGIAFLNGTASSKVLFNTLYTDAYTAGSKITSVNASVAAGTVFKGDLIVGAVANVTTGAGTSNVWTFSKGTAAITAGTGKDTVWFAAGYDETVNVGSFDLANDKVKFALAGSLKEIAKDYTFDVAGGATVIKGKEKADSVLTLTARVGDFEITDGKDKAYKVRTAAGGTAAFDADVNVYGGMATLKAAAATTGKVVVRVGEKSRGLDTSDTYYVANTVSEFDASASAAEFVLIGSSEQANTLKGGLMKNDLYGGGISADELHGHVAAVDTYWFGTGDGLDKVTNGLDKNDKIMLWNVKSSEIGTVKVELVGGEDKITLSDSSMLTLTDAGNAAIKGGLTFTTGDGVNFKYDAAEKKLVKA